jgi:hypothetical protein
MPFATHFARLPLGVAALLGGLASPAGASLLVYEPFDYPAGTVLEDVAATGLNLTGDYTAPSITTGFELRAGAPGLDYGSLIAAPSAAGQRLTQVTGTTAGDAVVSVDEDVVIAPGAAIYWSALFRLDDSSNGNRFATITLRDDDTGDFISFGEPPVGVSGLRVAASTTATGQLVADGADNAFSNGQTLWLVGRYVNAAAAGSDRLDLLVYDIADADAPAAAFDPADPAAELAFALTDLTIDLAKISSLVFTIRGDDNNFIDELRIGSSYAAVVPEPGAVALLGLGGAALAARARGARVPFKRRP